MTTKKNEHEVRNFEDLCNLVNNENYEILAEDLKSWLITYHLAITGIRERHPKETNGKLNTEIAKGGFTWIDDGKNDFKGFDVEFE